MHDCKHSLYPNQVSLWRLISPQKLVTYPRQSVGRGGRTKGKSCHERTGWCWWQWCWMKRVCPLAVSAAYPSPTPLYLSLSLVCFLPRCGYLQHTTECIAPRLYEYTTTLRKISTTAVTRTPRHRQQSFQKKTQKQHNAILVSPKNTPIYRNASCIRLVSIKRPFRAAGSSRKSPENKRQTLRPCPAPPGCTAR